ncbi:MAG: RNA methyltransferase [Caulobacterales bacterium]
MRPSQGRNSTRPGNNRGQKPQSRDARGPAGSWTKEPADPNAPYWLWGVHPVVAALANPDRKILRLCATRNGAERLPDPLPGDVQTEIIEPDSLAGQLPAGAVHQGLAVRVEPLPERSLHAVAAPAAGLVVVLDQVTDPQNVGAVFRSAAAFGARAVILQDRKAAPITGTLAKAAAGAVELVQEHRAANLSQAIEQLNAAGYVTIALSGDAEGNLEDVLDGQPTAIVLGSEGKGVRPSIAASCTWTVKIPIAAAMESLNVSAAAAIALYAARRALDSAKAEQKA